MKRALHFCMTLVLVVSMVSAAQAWDGFGHMVVASVAYRNLDSQTRKRVDKLLKRNPYHYFAGLSPAFTSVCIVFGGLTVVHSNNFFPRVCCP